MLGKYIIKGMRFHAFHGSNFVERELGIGFSVDVSILYPLSHADDTPDVHSKIKGAEIYDIVKDVMMNTKYSSRTSLCIEMAKRLYVQFRDANEIGIKITRTTIFIPGSIDSIDTEVWSKRTDFPELCL